MSKIKKTLKIIGWISVIIFTALIVYLIIVNSNQGHNSYSGGYAPDGNYCDYGYNSGFKACCDEDDYSCEFCDLYGIYCGDTSIVQGIEDVEQYPSKIGTGNYDCADFNTWEDAQKVFIRDNGIKEDPYHLDDDNDGIACEAKRELERKVYRTP
ncbi:hypothetical protein GW764_04070 [Candidatus Parcubacteria bacterium]|nr:hypothetical protein [Candidatus Parcubacteria bacterium]